MKYIIGAGIGGLFGLSAPLMMEARDLNNSIDSRQEESQPVEEVSPTPINNALTLPDDYCGYIDYESTDPKEQAKECLKRSIVAIPAIQYVDNVELKPGGVIIDHETGDVGLLVSRYDIMDHLPMTLDFGHKDDDYRVWAWEILWSGPAADKNNRYFPYTESGLLNMIQTGTFEYITAIEK